MKLSTKIYLWLQFGILLFTASIFYIVVSSGEFASWELKFLWIFPLVASVLLLVGKILVDAKRKAKEVIGEKVKVWEKELPVVNESIVDVKSSTFNTIKENYLWQAISLIAGELLILYILARFSLLSDFFVAVLILIPFWAYRRFKTKIYTIFMLQFAVANKFKFNRKGDHRIETGSIFDKGHSKKAYNLVEGSFLGYLVRLFNYDYIVGGGRSKETYKRTVFSLTFNKNMPHIYLDNISHDKALHVSGFEKISLESTEFNKEFRLLIKKGEHVPALQIFTPDVMAKLIDLPGRADVEFKGNKIYIYEDHLIGTKKELEETFELAKYLVHNMDHVLKSFKYETRKV